MAPVLILKERFNDLLIALAKERDQRPKMVTQPDGCREPAWVIYERERMHEAVTKERAKLGKGPVSLKEVERVEQLAVGHCDYGPKFSLYCAELVLQEKRVTFLAQDE